MSLVREEQLRKKRKIRLIKISLFFLVLGILFGAVVYCVHLSSLRISQVELSGGVLVTKEDVQKESLLYLSGAYYWMFPRNSIFMYPQEGLRRHLQDTFKRIDTISLSLKDGNILQVNITERKPSALWCDEGGGDGEVPEKCYFMDENSTIFATAPYFSGNAYFKYYGLLSATSSIIGDEYIASSTVFKDVSGFVENVKNMATAPVALHAENNNEFIMTLGSGAKIYFDMKEPLFKITSNLRTLLQSGTFRTLVDPTETIDYIDLRFGNKLFYKLK